MSTSMAIKELLEQIKALLNIKHLRKIEGSVLVTKTHIKDGAVVADTSKEKKLRARTFATQPASISYSFTRTKNLGNYESLKVGCMVTVPCYLEEIKEVAPEVESFTEGLIEKLLNKVSKEA